MGKTDAIDLGLPDPKPILAFERDADRLVAALTFALLMAPADKPPSPEPVRARPRAARPGHRAYVRPPRSC